MIEWNFQVFHLETKRLRFASSWTRVILSCNAKPIVSLHNMTAKRLCVINVTGPLLMCFVVNFT